MPNEALVARIFEESIKGRSAAKIAELLELDQTTVRVAMRDPAFRASVTQYRAEVVDAAVSKLHAQAELAVVQLGAVMTGKVKGTGAAAVVRAAEAVLDRIGVRRVSPLDEQRAPEAERIVNVLVQVISQHPEVKEQAMRAIEAEVVGEGEPH
jgi:hypothetical protein